MVYGARVQSVAFWFGSVFVRIAYKRKVTFLCSKVNFNYQNISGQ